MKSILCIIYWILLISITNAGTIDPNISDEKYIEYGKKFKCVMQISGAYDNENHNRFSASAVAIDSRWVLTAAHVVKDSKITFLNDIDHKKTIPIDIVICHKDFDENQFGFADIALCHTEFDIDTEFYATMYEDTDEINKICCISGYGHTGNFNTGITQWDGKRRAGSNKIDYIENDLLVCGPSIKNKTELEFLIGSGDSGGGLWIDGKLAGINSCIFTKDTETNSDYGDSSGHTRISKFKDWIKDKISK